MSVIKAVRVRPRYPNKDERLSSYQNDFGKKGALADLYVEISQSLLKYEVKIQPIAGPSDEVIEFKKKEFEDSDNPVDDALKKALVYVAAKKLDPTSGKKTVFVGGYMYQLDSQNYYEIIQDPWQDEPPIIRNFGFDSYYLNNGADILITWYKSSGPSWVSIGDAQNNQNDNLLKVKSILQTEPTIVSDGDKYILGVNATGKNWSQIYLDNPDAIVQWDDYNKKWTVTPATIGTSVYVESEEAEFKYLNQSKDVPGGGTEWSDSKANELTTSSSGLSSGVFTKRAEFGNSDERLVISDGLIVKKKYDDSDTKFSGTIKDINIIEQIISLWERKVPKYLNENSTQNGLKLCKPDYFPTVDLEYISPIEPLPPTEQAPVDNNNQTPEAAAEKFKLSVVYETNRIIKSGQDMPNLTIFFGDPPNDFQFTDNDAEDMTLLDPEYSETDFQGDGENIVTLEEKAENEREANANGGTQLDVPTGSYQANGIEPDTTFDPAKLAVPPGFNGVPLYFQYDNRWGNYNYGKGKKMECTGKNSGTISSSGCMPSSLSMMINYWAKKGYCKPVTPAIVGQFCVDYGGRVCGSGGSLTQVPKDKFKEVFGLNIRSFSGNITDAQVEKLLKAKFPMNHGGATKGKTAAGKDKSYDAHYLCLTGIDDQGRIRVNDSGNGPMGGKAITYYTNKWSQSNTRKSSQSYLYPDELGDPLA